jgi:hypothetical protein
VFHISVCYIVDLAIVSVPSSNYHPKMFAIILRMCVARERHFRSYRVSESGLTSP